MELLQETTIAPWDRPDWFDDASAWIQARVGGATRLRREAAQTWSVVVRVQTQDGLVWFKELGWAHAFEPFLTEVLARHVPRFLPQVVAAEGRRLLTLHAGPDVGMPRVRSTFLSLWSEVMVRYAELQIELSAVPGLPAPDSRPETVAQHVARPVRLIAALGDLIPPSLIHLDMTPRNVCLRDGSPVFIDWAGGAIGHPFCGLVKPLRTLVRRLGVRPGGVEVERVRDAYLEPWTTFAPALELRRIFAAAYPLGALCQLAALERRLASLPAALRMAHVHKLAKWRNRFAESARAPVRLGA
jgi:hypothetical protein